VATHKRSVAELSQTELAIATGVSIPTVRSRLAQAPAIQPVRSDGRTTWFDAPEALARILAPSARAGAEGGELLDLEAERARLAQQQTIGQRLRNDELARQLVRRDEVKQAWAAMALNFKEKIRSVPIVAMTHVPGFTREQARALATLLDSALAELAEMPKPHRTVRGHRARKATP
jgi:phage terminase Nu1 subunit (DNA packaging protein)